MYEADLTNEERELVNNARESFLFTNEQMVDICEDGSVWAGLVQILPVGSIQYRLT